ncbi:MAG: helix-turn-helix domain-containing protein [bacterium]
MNQTNNYSDILTRSGLTAKEASVYEILLQTGEIGMKGLLEKTPYKKGDLYNILYALRDKNFVESIEKDKKLSFKANDPYMIKDYLIDQAQRFRDAENIFSSVLPYLSDMFKMTTEKPIVRVLEGFDGIKELYEDTLRENSPIMAFLEGAESDKRVWRWLRDHYVEKRKKAHIYARVIVSREINDGGINEYTEKDKNELRETRIVNKKIFPSKLEIQIYGNKVSFANYNRNDALVGVIIDNKNIAESMRGLFELAWLGADKN